MRRLSFDFTGDSSNKARKHANKQENQSHVPLLGKLIIPSKKKTRYLSPTASTLYLD